jgi:hypothetical protein
VGATAAAGLPIGTKALPGRAGSGVASALGGVKACRWYCWYCWAAAGADAASLYCRCTPNTPPSASLPLLPECAGRP